MNHGFTLTCSLAGCYSDSKFGKLLCVHTSSTRMFEGFRAVLRLIYSCFQFLSIIPIYPKHNPHLIL